MKTKKSAHYFEHTPETVALIQQAIARRPGNPRPIDIFRMALRALDAFDRNGHVTEEDLLEPKARRHD